MDADPATSTEVATKAYVDHLTPYQAPEPRMGFDDDRRRGVWDQWDFGKRASVVS
jgi:hypothetical protein